MTNDVEQRLTNFHKGSNSKNFWFCSPFTLLQLLSSATVAWKKPLIIHKKWALLCSNKNLFTKVSGRLNLVLGPCIVDPWCRASFYVLFDHSYIFYEESAQIFWSFLNRVIYHLLRFFLNGMFLIQEIILLLYGHNHPKSNSITALKNLPLESWLSR